MDASKLNVMFFLSALLVLGSAGNSVQAQSYEIAGPEGYSQAVIAPNQVKRGEVNQVQTLWVWDQSGNRLKHTIARLYLDENQAIWVDFGENAGNRNAELRNGERLMIWGEPGRIDGRAVFMADQYRIRGRDILINRSGEKINWSTAFSTDLITGRVAEAGLVRLSAANRPDTCLRLRLQNGRTLLIDLGQPNFPARLDLDQGDNIAVRGSRFYIDGQPVIRAEHLWVNDQEVRLQHSATERS